MSHYWFMMVINNCMVIFIYLNVILIKQDLEKQIILDKLNDDLKEAKNKSIEFEKFLRKLKLI
jgi:hypothetical protein